MLNEKVLLYYNIGHVPSNFRGKYLFQFYWSVSRSWVKNDKQIFHTFNVTNVHCLHSSLFHLGYTVFKVFNQCIHVFGVHILSRTALSIKSAILIINETIIMSVEQDVLKKLFEISHSILILRIGIIVNNRLDNYL